MEILKGRPFGRTVQLSHVRAVRLGRDTGELEPVEYCMYGTTTRAAAQRYLRRMYKDDTITVSSVETDTDYYEIDLETFIADATKREEN